jgi:drug/metabolite transporter (DMT)-like permease
MLGFFCGMTATVFTSFSISYGNILLLASGATFTLLFNVFFSWLMLGEKVSLKYDGLAIFFILIG